MDPFTPLASLYIYSNAFVSIAVIRFIGISSLAAAIASNHRESTSEKKTCAGTRNSYCCWRLFLLVPPPLMCCYSATVWPSGIPAFLITDARPRRFAKSSFFNTFFLSFEHFLWPAIWCWISFVRSGAREIGEETRRKKIHASKMSYALELASPSLGIALAPPTDDGVQHSAVLYLLSIFCRMKSFELHSIELWSLCARIILHSFSWFFLLLSKTEEENRRSWGREKHNRFGFVRSTRLSRARARTLSHTNVGTFHDLTTWLTDYLWIISAAVQMNAGAATAAAKATTAR